MNEAELRALVRDAVARRLTELNVQPLGSAPASAAPKSSPYGFSHARVLTLVKAGDACFIEPAVSCNHCGYCESVGH